MLGNEEVSLEGLLSPKLLNTGSENNIEGRAKRR